MKYLDIVRARATGKVAIATTISFYNTEIDKTGVDVFSCSVTPLDPANWHEKFAWYDDTEIEILTNLLDIFDVEANTCEGKLEEMRKEYPKKLSNGGYVYMDSMGNKFYSTQTPDELDAFNKELGRQLDEELYKILVEPYLPTPRK